jgi:hypothetical protein
MASILDLLQNLPQNQIQVNSLPTPPPQLTDLLKSTQQNAPVPTSLSPTPIDNLLKSSNWNGASSNPSALPSNSTTLGDLSPQMAKAQKDASTPTGLTHFQGRPTGFWKNLGRIAEGVGNVVGDVFAPATMELIPGTQLNREIQASRGQGELSQLAASRVAAAKQASEDAYQKAETDKDVADAAKTRAETSNGGNWKPSDLTINGQPALINDQGYLKPANQIWGQDQNTQTPDSAVSPTGTGQTPTGTGTGQTGTGQTPTGTISPSQTGTGQTPPVIARSVAPNILDQKLGDPDKISALNAQLKDRWNILHPGAPIPAEYQLQGGATQRDADQLDKNLTATENAEATKANRDAIMQSRQASLDLRNQIREESNQTRINQDTTKAITKVSAPIRTSLTKYSDQLDRIDAATEDLSLNTAESTTIAIPKVLTALVSGAGSGVRITMPELNAIANSRGIAGDFQGTLKSWMGQSKLSDTQESQLIDVLNHARTQLDLKRQLTSDALDRMESATTPEEVTKAEKALRHNLNNASNYGIQAAREKRDLTTGVSKTDGKTYWLDGKGNKLEEVY